MYLIDNITAVTIYFVPPMLALTSVALLVNVAARTWVTLQLGISFKDHKLVHGGKRMCRVGHEGTLDHEKT